MPYAGGDHNLRGILFRGVLQFVLSVDTGYFPGTLCAEDVSAKSVAMKGQQNVPYDTSSTCFNLWYNKLS